MPPNREIELKLEVPAHLVAQLSRSAREKARVARSPKPSNLLSVYFDTDKLKLRNRGLSLRVRRIGGRNVQTIKREGEKAALFARSEWEQQIRGRQPDLNATRGNALKTSLADKLQGDLKPVFETPMRRAVYPIRNGKSEIELSGDNGTIKAGRL